MSWLSGLPWSLQAGGASAPTCAHRTEGSLLTNCNFTTDFLSAVLVPWYYSVGVWFVAIFWATLVFVIYVRYHNAPTALLVGSVVLVGGVITLPDQALPLATALVGSTIGVGLWYIISRTRGA